MQELAYTLLQTAIGACGIAWGTRGIVAVQLPEANESATRARLLRAHGAAAMQEPGPEIRRVIDDIVALLAGQPRDLLHARLDLAQVPPFHRRVYAIVRQIAPGRTRSYGEVAALCGERHAARGRPGNGSQSISDHRALSPGTRRRRPQRRLLRARRCDHQASTAHDRRRVTRDGCRRCSQLVAGVLIGVGSRPANPRRKDLVWRCRAGSKPCHEPQARRVSAVCARHPGRPAARGR